MDEAKDGTKPHTPGMRLSGERRDRFLEVLGQTGNRRAAADAIGVDPRLMDQRRRYDAPFYRQWKAALEQAGRRLAGAAGPLDCIGGRDLSVIKRGRGGRMQIVAPGRKRWSRDVEERFFAALGTCGNVAAAARAVGFTQTCVFRRRRQWVEFAQRWEQTLEDAEIRIEFRLATIGHDLEAAALERRGRPGEGDEPFAGGGTEAEALRFDPEFALRFLKWREDKRQGRGRGGRRKGWVKVEPTIEEARASIMRKIEAIERAEARGLASIGAMKAARERCTRIASRRPSAHGWTRPPTNALNGRQTRPPERLPAPGIIAR